MGWGAAEGVRAEQGPAHIESLAEEGNDHHIKGRGRSGRPAVLGRRGKGKDLRKPKSRVSRPCPTHTKQKWGKKVTSEQINLIYS